MQIAFNDLGSTIIWASGPGRRYQLETTSDLTTMWAGAGGAITANGATTSTSVSADAARKFYRVRLVP